MSNRDVQDPEDDTRHWQKKMIEDGLKRIARVNSPSKPGGIPNGMWLEHKTDDNISDRLSVMAPEHMHQMVVHVMNGMNFSQANAAYMGLAKKSLDPEEYKVLQHYANEWKKLESGVRVHVSKRFLDRAGTERVLFLEFFQPESTVYNNMRNAIAGMNDQIKKVKAGLINPDNPRG